jgi:hypothetical protein
MGPEDKERFLENYRWFNKFFQDVRQLVHNVHDVLAAELGYTLNTRSWYYEKSLHIPSLPSYWLNGVSEDGFALQTFVILDTSLLEAHPVFAEELSLVFVKHNRSDKYLHAIDYGLRVVKSSGITYQTKQEKFISGEIPEGEESSALYHAFQVPLGAFTAGQDINQVIREEIVAVLREMREWD